MLELQQGCPTGGPRVGCGPPAYIYVALKSIMNKVTYELE